MEREEFISKALLTRISIGEHDAFRVFYDSTYSTVYRFIHYFLSGKSDCEDVVSEVFFIIWKQRKGLLEIKNVKAWLYTVCRNEVYHFLRQKEKYPELSIDDMAVELYFVPPTADTELIEQETQKVYNDAIAKLPERCKLIFLMVREEQLRYKDIAAILSISEGTVEQQMNIAIRKITAVVNKHFPALDLQRRK